MRRQSAFDDIVWLQANKSIYSGISIDADALVALPDNGTLPDPPLVSDDRELDQERDTGPEQDGASGVGGDTEYFSAICCRKWYEEDATINFLLQKRLRAQRDTNGLRDGSLAKTAAFPVPWPDMEDTALNKFKTQGLCTLCYPTLFPYGSGDLTHVTRRHNETNAEGFKHLLRTYDGKGRGEHYRFATHPRFPHWTQNMLEQHRLLSQANVYVKHHKGGAALTVDDLEFNAAKRGS